MLARSSPVLLLAAALATVSAAQSQSPSLVKDINVVPVEGSSDPDEFTAVGSAVYFAATHAEHGRELFVTTGQPGTVAIVADTIPGPRGGSPKGLTAYAGRLFFSVDVLGSRQLWSSDGTAAGTMRLDVPDLAAARRLRVAGSTLFFEGQHAQLGWELWRSDGSVGGTSVVQDIYPGVGSGLTNLESIALGNDLIFVARTSFTTESTGLWKTDGTPTGTTVLRQMWQPLRPRFFTRVGGTVFFDANGLWKTDGTAAGTVYVSPKSMSAVYSSAFTYERPDATGFQNRLYFMDSQTSELWQSDGTAAGTTRVAAVQGSWLVAADDWLLFHGAAGLYRSDGTGGGTGVLLPGVGASWTTASGGNEVVFAGSEGSAGTELWRSDGTTGGTQRIVDLRPGPASSTPHRLRAVAGSVYFAAEPDSIGVEPFVSDRTASGTALLDNIYELPGHTLSSEPDSFADLHGVVLFTADDGQRGRELWRTDGTAAGTTLVADLELGALGSNPDGLMPWGTRVYFTASSTASGTELWSTDGTLAGTAMVRDIWPGPRGAMDVCITATTTSRCRASHEIVAAGDRLYFRADDGVAGAELWSSDGTAAGTAMVRDIVAGASGSFPFYLTAVGDLLFFTVYPPGAGPELWRSDGTAAGTFRLGFGAVTERVAYRGQLLFAGISPGTGLELWKSDGTVAGTVVVRDIVPGTSGSFARDLTVAGDTLFFVATHPDTGFELWKSDGTSTGTVLVRDITAGPTGSTILYLAPWRERIAFIVGLDRLWVSDGTAEGTLEIAAPGFTLTDVVALGSRSLYVTRRVSQGVELWRSDGTASGTSVVLQAQGPIAYEPQPVLIGGRVWFPSDDGVKGDEPWMLDPGATAQPVGTSCADPARMLRLDSDDPVLGASVGVTLAGALPGAGGALLLAAPRPPLQLGGGGCRFHLDPAGLVILAPISTPSGAWSTSVPLPDVAALIGARAGLQALVGPGEGPFGVDVTHAVVWTLGR